jgi:hypothetical protein
MAIQEAVESRSEATRNIDVEEKRDLTKDKINGDNGDVERRRRNKTGKGATPQN